MTALIVGASAGVGRALSEALAERGEDLLLVSSDARDLDALAAHLRLIHRVGVTTVEADANDVARCVEKICKAAESFGSIEGLYFPIGASRNDDHGLVGVEGVNAILNSNLAIVLGLTAQLLPRLLTQPKSQIVGFGSIASVRGRRSNVIYSAAKRGLQTYFESLRHLTAKTNVTVQFYQLGYVATQQSFGQSLLFPPVTSSYVAQQVICNLDKDFGRRFLPRYWSIIALMVRCLPWSIYKKLDF